MSAPFVTGLVVGLVVGLLAPVLAHVARDRLVLWLAVRSYRLPRVR